MGAFSSIALLSACVLTAVGLWSRRHGLERLGSAGSGKLAQSRQDLSPARVGFSMAVLVVLVFSKFIYIAGVTSYYTFYLIQRFGISLQDAQLHLFVFLAAAAAGTLAGGPLGDRFGRKQVIWFSILGVLPFTLVLPHADLAWTRVLSMVIAFILASAFPAIVVYGQELIPGRVGLVAGLFFGLSFGAAGLGAALMGRLADATSVETVYQLCAVLPAMGLLAALLPDVGASTRSSVQPLTTDS
jgi:FSR family fosmidomycin resistance protein-like MFS transporter